MVDSSCECNLRGGRSTAVFLCAEHCEDLSVTRGVPPHSAVVSGNFFSLTGCVLMHTLNLVALSCILYLLCPTLRLIIRALYFSWLFVLYILLQSKASSAASKQRSSGVFRKGGRAGHFLEDTHRPSGIPENLNSEEEEVVPDKNTCLVPWPVCLAAPGATGKQVRLRISRLELYTPMPLHAEDS
ncbi:hypothetical protein EYF80_008560 [Liparis tanakae]|uniref:Uncharacterized protein n=1 Tax=Liparis tanakae TaxID=230148 RepID=A0A4Z2ITQ4_9TELE|nr:hypothetical protein EYF80_008560 [Liparis tanakae]